MPSTLSWLQFDTEQARRSRELVRALEEPSTLDSIGIGTIRDGFADTLFPGTSTIHTRVRYFLLVPWAMQWVAQRRPRTRDQYDRWLRDAEVATIDALKAGDPTAYGIIGVNRGKNVQTLPGVIYWSALAAWGIRVNAGLSRSALRDLVLSDRKERRSDDSQAMGYVVWDAMPEAPDGFPNAPLTTLPTPEEADYLLAKMASTQTTTATTAPEPTALAQLSRHPQYADLPHVWNLPRDVLSGSLAEIVEMAWGFALVIQGARLRYLDLLFRRKAAAGHDLDRTALDQLVADWFEEMQTEATRTKAWLTALPAMFDLLRRHRVRIGMPLHKFVSAWSRAAVADPHEAFASRTLGDLITTREADLKRSAARLTNDSPLASWNGELLGSDRLDYRWSIASGHVRDCVAGKEAD